MGKIWYYVSWGIFWLPRNLQIRKREFTQVKKQKATSNQNLWFWLLKFNRIPKEISFLLSYLLCCMLVISLVQSLSHVRLFATPWTSARQASLSITDSSSFLKLMSIQSLNPSKHLILCRSLLLLSIFPSIRVFSNESVLPIRWPNYWSFSFSISPSNKYSGLISFRIDWFDLAVQGTLKSLLQQYNSKAPILWCFIYSPTLRTCLSCFIYWYSRREKGTETLSYCFKT